MMFVPASTLTEKKHSKHTIYDMKILHFVFSNIQFTTPIFTSFNYLVLIFDTVPSLSTDDILIN